MMSMSRVTILFAMATAAAAAAKPAPAKHGKHRSEWEQTYKTGLDSTHLEPGFMCPSDNLAPGAVTLSDGKLSFGLRWFDGWSADGVTSKSHALGRFTVKVLPDSRKGAEGGSFAEKIKLPEAVTVGGTSVKTVLVWGSFGMSQRAQGHVGDLEVDVGEAMQCKASLMGGDFVDPTTFASCRKPGHGCLGDDECCSNVCAGGKHKTCQ